MMIFFFSNSSFKKYDAKLLFYVYDDFVDVNALAMIRVKTKNVTSSINTTTPLLI